MNKFLVLFLTPVAVLENWMQTDPVVRKEAEETMQKAWGEWMMAHGSVFIEAPVGAGKTKSVNLSGVSDTKNDIMLYGIVQAESHAAAAELFVGHPHLQIPEATIQISSINSQVGGN